MADDKKQEPIPFPVEMTVNGVKVTVTLMLKPGTTVSVAEKEQQETKEDQPQDET
jgi:ribosomal protein S4